MCRILGYIKLLKLTSKLSQRTFNEFSDASKYYEILDWNPSMQVVLCLLNRLLKLKNILKSFITVRLNSPSNTLQIKLPLKRIQLNISMNIYITSSFKNRPICYDQSVITIRKPNSKKKPCQYFLKSYYNILKLSTNFGTLWLSLWEKVYFNCLR